jgi:predicted transposase YbfD/YdcC
VWPLVPPTPVPLAAVAPELFVPPVVAAFAALPDPRVDRTKRHALRDIVAITLCAVLAGAETWVDIAAFGQAREAWFRTFLRLPHGIPSHDTFGRVFARLDPAAFARCVQAWVATVATLAAGEVVALDGKTVRGSGTGATREGALHVVSAWASEAGLTLGQVRTPAKGNEITALPELLALLDVTGAVVTIDAIGCQTALATQIRAQGADYLLAVKGNQPWLHDRVGAAFADAEAHGWHRGGQAVPHTEGTTVEKGHGRLETRRVTAVPAAALLVDRAAWADLASVVRVEATRQRLRPDGGAAPGKAETRYYITSLPAEAARLGAVVRRHWSIENRCHWTLDVAFHEDACRIRRDHAPENLALVRKVALALLRQDRTHKHGLTSKRLRAGWDHEYLQTVLHGARAD